MKSSTAPTVWPRPPRPTFLSNSDACLAYVVGVLANAGALTRAEREVLRALMLGRGYTEIATMRGTSPHTVGVQVKAVLRHLGAANSRDLFRVFLCEMDREGTCMVLDAES